MLMVLPSQFQLRLMWYNMDAAYVLLFKHIYSRVGDASRHLLQLDLATLVCLSADKESQAHGGRMSIHQSQRQRYLLKHILARQHKSPAAACSGQWMVDPLLLITYNSNLLPQPPEAHVAFSPPSGHSKLSPKQAP